MKHFRVSPPDEEEKDEYRKVIQHLISISAMSIAKTSDKILKIRRTVEPDDEVVRQMENEIDQLVSQSYGALEEAHNRLRVNGQTIYPDEAAAIYQILNNIKNQEPITADSIRERSGPTNPNELLASPEEKTELSQIQSDIETVAQSIRNRHRSKGGMYHQPSRIAELVD